MQIILYFHTLTIDNHYHYN